MQVNSKTNWVANVFCHTLILFPDMKLAGLEILFVSTGNGPIVNNMTFLKIGACSL